MLFWNRNSVWFATRVWKASGIIGVQWGTKTEAEALEQPKQLEMRF